MAIAISRSISNVSVPTYVGGTSIVPKVCGYDANNSKDSTSVSIHEESQALRTSLTAYQLRLISAWEFNETSAGVFNVPRADSRGLNHLTDNNSTPSASGLASGDALAARFVSGNFNFFSRTAGTITGIEGKTGDFAIETHFKLNSVGVIQTLIAKGATANNIAGFWVFVSATNRLQLNIGNGTARVTLNPATTLSVSTNYHLVLNCDRDGNAEFFLNNSSIGSISIASIPGGLGSSTDLTIGQTSGVTYLSADVSYVRFWDGLLDATDRTYLRNSGNLKEYSQL